MNRLERRRLGRRKHLEAVRRIRGLVWCVRVSKPLAIALNCPERPWFRLTLAPLDR